MLYYRRNEDFDFELSISSLLPLPGSLGEITLNAWIRPVQGLYYIFAPAAVYHTLLICFPNNTISSHNLIRNRDTPVLSMLSTLISTLTLGDRTYIISTDH